MKKTVKIPKFKIRSGDLVKVIAGDAKGRQGKVLSMEVKNGKAIVEGINLVSKHVKPNAKNPNGGIIKMEAPIHISNLMLIDPKSGEPTKVGRKMGDNGKLVRYSKKSKEEIK